MAAVAVAGRRPIVLVVDDNAKVRDALVEILGDLDTTVLVAEGADQAVDLVDGTEIDLLLTDLVLGPHSSGIDLARFVRGCRPTAAAIVLSAYDESQLDLSGLAEGVEFWSKPADIDRLAARLDALRHR